MNVSFKKKTCPEYFDLSSIGESKLGFISAAEFPNNIPFEIFAYFRTFRSSSNQY